MAKPGRWTLIGPTRINDGGLGSIGRVHSIAVDPATPSTLYVGGPTCGIWKTTDGGAGWTAVGDTLPALSLSALAVDPLTPARVYAVIAGGGVFRSDDAAATWNQIADDPGTIKGAAVLLIDPSTPSRLFLTTRTGALRSDDSGVTWALVKSGQVNDLVIDPSNPSILFAGVQGDGVYKTTTSGGTGDPAWTKLAGIPSSGFTRVTLALCRDAPSTVYAGLSGSPFRLFRTTNGATFGLRFTADASIYNPWIGVDPSDADTVYILSANFRRSTDGGSHVSVTSNDLHECQKITLDPVSAGVFYLGRDNGLFRVKDHGTNFSQIGRGIANVEFYDGALAATDAQVMIGGTQDNGTIRIDGSSTVWTRYQGGDGATVAIDPTDAQIMYQMGQYASSITRSTDGGVSTSNFAVGLPPGNACFNLHFHTHPTTPSTLLASCRSLWRITDPSGSWAVIFTPPSGNVLRSDIDPSVDLYYAGTDGGTLFAGPGGSSFQQVFAHPGGRGFTDLLVDPDDRRVVYATFSGTGALRVYRLSRTAPAPTTLTADDITADLPSGLSATTVTVDRMNPGTVYVGTNQGVYRGVSTDHGASWNWTTYNDGMPLALISSLDVHPRTGAMVAMTYGRSAFTVDTDSPIGSLLSASGHISFLRVHDAGTGFGPPNDFLDVEVVVMLDTQPDRGFGIQLRADAQEHERHGTLDILRDAFNRDSRVTIDYVRTGLRNGRIVRVADLP